MSINKYLAKPYAPETYAFRKKGGCVLSPSGIAKFFNEPNEWYMDRIGKTTFDGNSNTVLGNAIHAAIDAYWDGEEVTEDDVVEWMNATYQEQMDTVNEYGKAKVDPEFVVENFMNMFIAWKYEYGEMYPKPDLREYFVSTEITPYVLEAGTLDGYEEDRKVVMDYKTTGRITKVISPAHEFQLMAYAKMLIDNGIEVDTIRVIYIVRPTKTIAARVVTIDKEITSEMLLRANHTSKLMIDSWQMALANPKMAELLFRPNPMSKY